MQSKEQLRFAGDVNIDRVQIITQKGFYQDVTAQMLTIQFYEDLFSPFISGSIILRESLDLVNLFPLIGEEYINVDISTPTIKESAIKGKYYIYKMSDREILGDRNVVYQLHFISVEAITDLNKKISRTFGNKVSELVEPFIKDKTLGLESEKSVVVEATNNNIKYISNYWSPVKNLLFLTENALNTNGTPNYVFFENRDGFYFVSLETLYQNGVKQEFVYDKFVRDRTAAGDVRNIPEEYKRILEINIPVAYDYMDRIRSGMLASRQVSYDVVKKTYSAKNYNAVDRFETQKHLNTYSINSNSAIFRANSLIINFPKHYGNFNGFGDVTNSKFNQERISTMKLAESNKISITVPGRTDYTVGQKVKVALNRMEPMSEKDDDMTDKIFSGNYLISAINHYIDKEKHECYMELIKESSMMDMNRGKK
jgi:hypothetical protein